MCVNNALTEDQKTILKDQIKVHAKYGSHLREKIDDLSFMLKEKEPADYLVELGGRRRMPLKLALSVITAIEASQGSTARMMWLWEFLKPNGEFQIFLQNEDLDAFFRPSSLPSEPPEDNSWSRTLKRDMWRIALSSPVEKVVKTLGSQEKELKEVYIEHFIKPTLKAVSIVDEKAKLKQYIEYLESIDAASNKPLNEFLSDLNPEFLRD